MRGGRPANGGGGRAKHPRGLTLRLTPAQRSILLRACRDQRNAIPAYLAAHRDEVRLLDELIRALD